MSERVRCSERDREKDGERQNEMKKQTFSMIVRNTFVSNKHHCFKRPDFSPADVLGVGSVTDTPVIHMKIITELR